MVAAVNLNFFAAETDQRALLDFLFASTDVRVFESYSEFDADLREFRSTDDLASAFPIGLDPHGNGAAVTVVPLLAVGLAQTYHPAVRPGSGEMRRRYLSP